MKNARDIIARGMAASAASGGGGGGGPTSVTLPVVFSIEWDDQSDGAYGVATADQTIAQIYQAQIDGLVVVGVYGYGSDSSVTSVSLDLVESTTADEAAASVTFRGISSEHVTLEITGTVDNGADSWVATSHAAAPELPTPTVADVGKSITIQPVGGAVIAPWQSVVPDDEGVALIPNFNTELFVEGATVLVELNGEKMVGTVGMVGNTQTVVLVNPLYVLCRVYLYNNNAYVQPLYARGGNAPVITIRVSVFDSYQWAETPPNTLVVYQGESDILTKTWQEIYDALTCGIRVIIVAGGFDNYGFISQDYVIRAMQEGDDAFSVVSASSGVWIASTADDYPILD